MPADVKKKVPGGKNAKQPAKVKELPKELCGCGVDTYRPPPKGKKVPEPVVHNPGCGYQRTTCDAYPNLPRCPVCQNPCKFCAGKNRWCPHCYENQCQFRYKRLVHGFAPPAQNVGPASPEALAASAAGNSSSGARKSTAVGGDSSAKKDRSHTVTFNTQE